jgi:hypothetical protein
MTLNFIVESIESINFGSSQNFGKTAHHGLKPVAIYRQPFRLNDVKTQKKRYFTA